LLNEKKKSAVRLYAAIPDWQSYEDVMQQYKENCVKNYAYER